MLRRRVSSYYFNFPPQTLQNIFTSRVATSRIARSAKNPVEFHISRSPGHRTSRQKQEDDHRKCPTLRRIAAIARGWSRRQSARRPGTSGSPKIFSLRKTNRPEASRYPWSRRSKGNGETASKERAKAAIKGRRRSECANRGAPSKNPN